MQQSSFYYFENSTKSEKGPVPENILLRLLEKGVGVSGDTLVWNSTMSAWAPMSEVVVFKELAIFTSANWHYVDPQGQETKGPISTRMILHKIKEGDIDGLTLVYSREIGMEKWKTVSEVESLKSAMHKIAMDEENVAKMIQQSAATNEGSHHQQTFSMSDLYGDEIGVQQKAIREYKSMRAATGQTAMSKSSGGEREKDAKGGANMPGAKVLRGDDGVLYKLENDTWVETSDTEDADGAQKSDDSDADVSIDSDGGSDREDVSKRNKHSGGDNISKDNASNNSTNSDGQPNKRKRSKKKKKKAPNTWIYIKCLPADVTFEELKSHFSSVGLIALNPSDFLPRIKIYRDDRGLCKGDASICYHNEGSVELAVSILDDGFLRPSVKICVAKGDFNWTTSGDNSSGGGGARSMGSNDTRRKIAKLAMQQALSWNEDVDYESKAKKSALKIVVIEGMFIPEDFVEDPKFEEEIEKDIYDECSKSGDVEKITLFSKNPAGVVIVKYKTSAAAEACRQLMDGRFFAKRKLRSYYWDGVTNFALQSESASKSSKSKSNSNSGDVDGCVADAASDPCDDDSSEDDLDREERRRLEEFGNMLDSQEDLPAEFRLRTE